MDEYSVVCVMFSRQGILGEKNFIWEQDRWMGFTFFFLLIPFIFTPKLYMDILEMLKLENYQFFKPKLKVDKSYMF
jgi:hypothetical protein